MSANPQISLALKKCESINLKKMKSDTLLMIVSHLLKEFEEIKANDSNNFSMSTVDAHFLNNQTQNLIKFLNENVMDSSTLSYVFQNKNNCPIARKLSIHLEPMRAYYKYIITIFSSRLNKGAHWIPELLAYSLIHSYKKEFGKSFSNYSFIDEFPIDEIIQIYFNKNVDLKKQLAKENNESIWKIQTVIDEMYEISEYMVEKYITYNYKVNSTRVSKTRKKKR